MVLTVLTCSAYLFYWFYKTWRDLAAQAESLHEQGVTPLPAPIKQFHRASPMLRTLAVLIPFVQIYPAATLIKGIAELHPAQRSFPRRHPLISCSLLIAAVVVLSALAELKSPLCFFSFLVCVPFAVAQSWLNSYWRSVETEPRVVRHAFTGKELIAILAGSVWLGLVLAYPFLM